MRARFAGGQMALEQRGIEQFGRRRLAAALAQRLGQLQIGAIGIDQAVAGIAGKGRLAQQRQDRADAGQVGIAGACMELAVTSGLQEGRAQAQRGAAAQHPAIGADDAAIERIEAGRKGMALHPQILQHGGQLLGIGIMQPALEIEHALGLAPGRQHRRGLAEELDAPPPFSVHSTVTSRVPDSSASYSSTRARRPAICSAALRRAALPSASMVRTTAMARMAKPPAPSAMASGRGAGQVGWR